MAKSNIEAIACTGPVYRDGYLILNESFQKQPESPAVLSIGSDYIAGIYYLFDCHQEQRVSRSPILLRLENDDYVFRISEDGFLLAWKGALLDLAPVCDCVENVYSDVCCWIWSIDSQASDLVGCALEAVSASSEHLAIMGDNKSRVCFG